ncbi:hypothetical protein PG987_004991 [Apiospora arundinis]
MVNYAIAPKQTDYIFGLTEPHTAAFAGVSTTSVTTSVPSSRSTHGASDASSSAQNTDGPTISVTTAGTSEELSNR